jgi:microcystin-dependent protein
VEWEAIINGLIGAANTASYWQEMGGITAEQAAEKCTQIFTDFLNAGECDMPIQWLVGEIKFIAGSNVPVGWVLCDGAEYNVDSYPELFAAIEYTYTPPTTPTGFFRVPDLQGRSPMGAGTPAGIGGASAMVRGQMTGEQEHTLSVGEMPSHVHQVRNRNQVPAFFHTGTAGANPSIGDIAGTTNSTVQNTTTGAGSGAAHNTIHPVLVANFIIFTGK